MSYNDFYKNILLESEDTEKEDDEFVPSTSTEDMTNVNAACALMGISPPSKIKKLSSERRSFALKSKLQRISESIKRNLEISFDQVIEDPEVSVNAVDEFEELITKLKEKCAVADKEEKIKIISLLPNSWTRKKITTEFNVSDRLVKLTKGLVKDQGILPELRKKKGFGIQPETLATVHEFYESDEYSRLCPRKKDCLSVKVNNVKVTKQKRLILCNLNELFVEFKAKNPNCKIGRSKFIELRPKWCIIAGSSGTHTVCVCSYHQNIKLMIDGAKINTTYKDLLDILVCDMNNYDCMMDKCIECPGREALLDTIQEFENSDIMPDNIIYKQWVTTDRAEMVTVVQPQAEFFESLLEKLVSLKTHHYIAKLQTQFLQEKKEQLSERECIVLADFSENFKFVVQDEIQSYHWVNQQATVHPFIYYHKVNSTLCSQCICVISDTTNHNTVTVHMFLTYLMKHIKETIPHVNKIIYFSDGASSQYKNKKKFMNLCQHKNDFRLDAEWNFFATSHGKNACDGV